MTPIDWIQTIAGTISTLGLLAFTGYKYKQGQRRADARELEQAKAAEKAARAAAAAAKVAERNQNHDQLQEDLAAERKARIDERKVAAEERQDDRKRIAELEAARRDDHRRIADLESGMHHLEDEILALRRGVLAGEIPPLPDRVGWRPKGDSSGG